MDMRHGGLVLRDMHNSSGAAEFAAVKKRLQHDSGQRAPRGISGAADQGELPQAITVAAAGCEGANGLYRATAKEECGAPVYERMEGGAFRICRNATTSKKTGQQKHGWLLSEKGAALYGAPTEARAVPSAGWKAFGGKEPLPEIRVHSRLADVFLEQADAERARGDAAAAQEDWQVAYDAFAASLQALDRSGDRFGEPFEERAASVLATRSRCLLQQEEPRPALRDAIAALEIVPGCQKAEAAMRAAAGAESFTAAMLESLQEEVGQGKILDRGAPLSLGIVEKWIEAFAPRDGRRAPFASGDFRQRNDAWTDCDRTRQVY